MSERASVSPIAELEEISRRPSGVLHVESDRRLTVDTAGSVSSNHGALKHDLLSGMSAEERKKHPLYSGVIAYFRDALFMVARISYDGNEQHNPGMPLHWARGKSTDQLDCVLRHVASFDEGNIYELGQAAWRALAQLQIALEKEYGILPPPNARSDT